MSIGGVLRYDLLAQLNRPTDNTVLSEEVRRLARNGLTPLDISVALRIDLGTVRTMLAASPTEAAQAWQR